MNYRDLQNISNLSQEILIEGANEEHNVLNRWPYTSPYLQESTEVVEEKKPLPVGKMDAKAKELKSKFHKSKVGTPEASKLLSRLGHIVAARDSKVVSDSYDLYDIILSHLLDEGYAETQEQAEVIMVNMSEGWRESIFEGEEDYKPLPRRKMLNKSNKLRKSGDVNKKARSADIEHQLRAHSPEASKTSSYVNRAYGRGSDN
jgi:hypothetical protein